LPDGNNISSAKLRPVNNTNDCISGYFAIYCYNYQGPRMGSLNCSNSNNWTCDTRDTRYPNMNDIPSNFTIENFEVFQVIKQ
jgi:hypothetical protein